MSTENFISQIMNGDLSNAKETLTDVLSAKAFEALDGRKQEIAKTIYSSPVESEIETEEEDTQEQEAEEDQ